jgi:hypothetical protein
MPGAGGWVESTSRRRENVAPSRAESIALDASRACCSLAPLKLSSPKTFPLVVSPMPHTSIVSTEWDISRTRGVRSAQCSPLAPETFHPYRLRGQQDIMHKCHGGETFHPPHPACPKKCGFWRSSLAARVVIHALDNWQGRPSNAAKQVGQHVACAFPFALARGSCTCQGASSPCCSW